MINRAFLFIVILAAAAFFAACGSGTETNSATNAQGTKPAGNAPGTIAGNANASVTTNIGDQQIPGITGPATNVDANTPGAGNLAMANRRKAVDVGGPMPSGPPPSVPAGENSAITTTMAKDGSFVESRVFTGDKDIAKIERNTNGNAQTVKIFLTSGRVVSVTPAKVPAINTLTLAAIRTLAGVKQPTPPPMTRQEQDELKKKQSKQ